MARRGVLIAAGAAAVVGVAVAAVVAAALWRVPLAQALLDRAIAELDIPGARATVQRLAVDRLRAVDLVAGERAELAIESVEIEFAIPELLRGRIDRLAVDGPTLRLDLRAGAAPFGSLQPLVDRARRDGGSDEAEPLAGGLPAVELNDARIAAETPYGPASLALDGAYGGRRAGDPTLRLDGRLSSDWARLDARLSATGDPQGSAEARIAISDGAVELPGDLLRIRRLSGDLDLRVAEGRPQSGEGELAADGLAVAGTPFDRAEAGFALSRDRAELSARLASDDDSFALSLDGRAEALDAAPEVSLELTATIGEAAPLWALGRPPWPRGGRGRIALAAAGQLPGLPRLTADPAAWLAWLAEGALSGTATAEVSRLALSGAPAEAEAEASLDLDAAWADGGLRLATRRENRLAASGLSAEDLTAYGLPADLAAELVRLAGGRVALSLPAPSQPPTVLTWRLSAPAARFDGSAVLALGPLAARLVGQAEARLAPAPGLARADLREIEISAEALAVRGQSVEDLRVTGEFRGAPEAFEASGEIGGSLAGARLGDVAAERVSLALPFQVSREAGAVDLALPRAGRATLTGLRALAGLTADAPVEIALHGGEARLTLPDADSPARADAPALAFAARFAARLGVEPARLQWRREDGTRVPLELSLPELEVDGELLADGRSHARAAVENAAVTLPDLGLAVAGVAADLTLPGPPDRADAAFEIAALRHLGSPAAFAPLGVAGRAARRGDDVEVTAEVHGPDGQPLADVTARHDLAAGSGRADIALRPLRFAPDGLQPAALSPLLALVSDARGGAEGGAALAWDRDGLAGTASLTLRDLAFSLAEAKVAGLDLDLELDSLQPPTSPPNQRLSADLIDVGVPLKDFAARFRLPADAPGQVLLEEASFSTVGSHVTVGETLIDPSGERLDTQLLVEDLEVSALFEVLAVDGLSGKGELAGRIPVRREGGRVVIADARLEANGPGVLRFRSDAAARALAGGGEHVDLVIRALEDFHYETLVLTGNLDQGGEARLRLEILGNNPEVLDGYPFQLNINLTGDSTPILEALRLSRSLIADILERARKLSE